MKKERLAIMALLLPLVSGCASVLPRERRLPSSEAEGDGKAISISLDEALEKLSGDLTLATTFEMTYGGVTNENPAYFYYDEKATRFDLGSEQMNATVYMNDYGMAVTYGIGPNGAIIEQPIESSLVSFGAYFANPFARIGIEDLEEGENGNYALSETMATYIISRLAVPAGAFSLSPLGSATGTLVLEDDGFASFSLSTTMFTGQQNVGLVVSGTFSYGELEILPPTA